jgi:RES domain-containing protein
MLVFRIARKRYIRDLTGQGAKLYGGRWNPKGLAVIYTSETRALAVVEYLVHVSWPQIPTDLQISTLQIPDGLNQEVISSKQLPKNWKAFPPPEKLAHLGAQWVQSNKCLLLQVPSAVVDREHNTLLNPAHPDMSRVKIGEVQDLRIDRRLVDKKSYN